MGVSPLNHRHPSIVRLAIAHYLDQRRVPRQTRPEDASGLPPGEPVGAPCLGKKLNWLRRGIRGNDGNPRILGSQTTGWPFSSNGSGGVLLGEQG